MDRHDIALKRFAEGTVIPATPLALNNERRLDETRQRALARYYLKAGAGGLAAAVHTTQFEIRDPKIGLFEPVLKIAMEEALRFEQQNQETVVMVAGVCGDTNQAVCEAQIAKKTGYDAVLLSPGGLGALSEEQMLERTRAVAEIMPVIGFYLQPSVGGRVFGYEYWSSLCNIENVVGIKSAPFNRYLTLDLVRAAALSPRSNEISLYTGNDDNIVVDLLTKYRFEENGRVYEKGFIGGLLGHWAVWTKKAAELFWRMKTEAGGNSISQELLTLAAQITDANAAFFDTANNFKGCIAGIHEVLYRQGLLEGIWCLDENETLSKGQKEEIDRVYRMYPYLNDDAFVKENLAEFLRQRRRTEGVL